MSGTWHADRREQARLPIARERRQRHTRGVQTTAQVIAVHADETVVEGEMEMLPIELDAIPGAVWQMELHGLMPPEVRVSLFERGSRKCALLKFARGHAESARAAFESALEAANAVSQEVHRSAAQAARRLREQADTGQNQPD
jgi:hypothetical protein